MALSRISTSILLMFVLFLASFSSSMEARKLLNSDEVKKVANLRSLYLNALPKGIVPASTPSKKGHSYTTDEKLIARHLAAIDRILRSVPSPGVGH
ncbi:precursor of CEP14-like [Solanum verrucosum]|uniref:precursor of CEP14-like n=1 Tax=Solanum verrucosum TaxID=315347 RepID=UPI0020D1BDD3|nr:precursor of CEP14-like [Solanum verrucosum]